MKSQILKHLGRLGTGLPELTEEEWRSIFEFLEYFILTEDDQRDAAYHFNWSKVRDILALVDKIK
jgi:hypothetical protein